MGTQWTFSGEATTIYGHENIYQEPLHPKCAENLPVSSCFFLLSSSFLFPEEGREDGQAVDLLGGSATTELGQGGKDVGLVKNEVAHLAVLDLIGPADEKWNAQSPLVETAFSSPELDTRLWVNVRTEVSPWVIL